MLIRSDSASQTPSLGDCNSEAGRTSKQTEPSGAPNPFVSSIYLGLVICVDIDYSGLAAGRAKSPSLGWAANPSPSWPPPISAPTTHALPPAAPTRVTRVLGRKTAQEALYTAVRIGCERQILEFTTFFFDLENNNFGNNDVFSPQTIWKTS